MNTDSLLVCASSGLPHHSQSEYPGIIHLYRIGVSGPSTKQFDTTPLQFEAPHTLQDSIQNHLVTFTMMMINFTHVGLFLQENARRIRYIIIRCKISSHPPSCACSCCTSDGETKVVRRLIWNWKCWLTAFRDWVRQSFRVLAALPFPLISFPS